MEKNNRQPESTRLQRIIAGVLAALFLVTIVGFGVYGVLSNPSGIWNSVRFHKAKAYLADPDDTSFFPMTKARIMSLENRLGKNLPFNDELNIVNASFQYAIGRNLVVKGADQMLRLPNEQLYYITTRDSLAEQAQDVVDLYNYIDGKIPFFYAYVHPGFFNGGMQLPDGYSVMDTSDELADEILGIIREAGIETLDSRTFFEDTGLTNEELMLKTDKHWTYLAALLASQIYAEKINSVTGANLDVSKLDLDQFDTEVLEDRFFGEFGRLIGLNNSLLEDITIYTPKYETNLTRHSEHRTDEIEDETGPFEESMIRSAVLGLEEGKIWSEFAYVAYGLIEAFEEVWNHGECEDMTILVLRDSFSAPICRFLSLLTSHVVSADLRYSELNAVELIEKYDPDLVIVSYSRFMFEADIYDFGPVGGVDSQ